MQKNGLPGPNTYDVKELHKKSSLIPKETLNVYYNKEKQETFYEAINMSGKPIINLKLNKEKRKFPAPNHYHKDKDSNMGMSALKRLSMSPP